MRSDVTHFNCEITGSVATVSLARPERKNPLSFDSYAELRDWFRDLHYDDDVKAVVAGLWDLAVSIEEGSLENIKGELQALKKELERALQDGAPPERIAELMDKMREAMDKFMQAMREEAERRVVVEEARGVAARPGARRGAR